MKNKLLFLLLLPLFASAQLPDDLDFVYPQNDGYLIAGKHGVFSVYDTTGKLLIAPQYAELRYFGNQLFMAKEAGTFKAGLINIKGDIIIPLKYKKLRKLGDCFLVESPDYMGLFYPNGKKATALHYCSITLDGEEPHLFRMVKPSWAKGSLVEIFNSKTKELKDYKKSD